jgi:hypothetical protein
MRNVVSELRTRTYAERQGIQSVPTLSKENSKTENGQAPVSVRAPAVNIMQEQSASTQQRIGFIESVHRSHHCRMNKKKAAAKPLLFYFTDWST